MKHFKLLMLLALALLLPVASYASVPEDYDFYESCNADGITDGYNQLSSSDIYYKITGETTCKVVGVLGYSGYYSSSFAMIVPETIYNWRDGKTYTVTEIGAGACMSEQQLGYVSLPSTVTTIGDEAFYGCYNLYTFLNSANLAKIGNYAFEHASPRVLLFVKDCEMAENAFTNAVPSRVICSPAMKTALQACGLDAPYISWMTFTGDVAYEDGILYKLTSGTKTSVLYGGTYNQSMLNLPNTVTEIDEGAFQGNLSICDITIPSSVRKIGKMAFGMCSKIYQITIHSTQCEFDDYSFTSLAQLTSIDLSGAVRLGEGVLSHCRALRSVKLPSGLTEIPSFMFQECEELREVNVPSTVTAIGNAAFYNCSKIENLTLPANLSSVGNQAFYYCKLGSLTVNDDFNAPMGSLEGAIFDRLEFKTAASIISYGSVFEGCEVSTLVVPSDATQLPEVMVKGMSSFTIPSKVTHIPANFFQGNDNLTTFTVPSNVTSIGNNAFQSSALASITLHSKITSIGLNAFAYTKLTSITIPEGVTELASNTFSNCKSLTTVVLPSTLKKIGTYAFSNCTALKTVDLPLGLTSIGGAAFNNSGVTQVIVPPTVAFPGSSTSSSVDPFYGKTSIKLLLPSTWSSKTNYSYAVFYTGSTMPEKDANGVYYSDNGATLLLAPTTLTGDFTVPATVTSIGNKAFYGCTFLTGLNFAGNVTSIGSNAFYGCSGLKNVNLPAGLTSLGGGAFTGTGISDIIVPPGVPKPSTTAAAYNPFYSKATIRMVLPSSWSTLSSSFTDAVFYTGTAMPTKGTDDFYYGDNGQTLLMAPKTLAGAYTTPEGITKIGSYAFRGCTGLTSVNIRGSVTDVESYAFNSCSGITKIQFNEGLTNIGTYAFNSTKATEVILPSTVKTVGANAFPSTIKYRITPNTLTTYSWPSGSQGLQYTPTAVTIVMHADGSVGAVSKSDGTKSLYGFPTPADLEGDTYVVPSDYKVTSTSAYLRNSNITKVVIPGTVERVTATFKDATHIKSVELGEGIKTIGTEAFKNTNIATIVLPSTVTAIGSQAFAGSKITSIVIPAGVTSVSADAFNDCAQLTTAVYPEGLDITFPETVFAAELPAGYDVAYGADGSILAVKDDERILIAVPASAIAEDGSYTIAEDVTKVGKGAFKSCASMTSVTIPDNVMTIGEGAFQGLTGLANVIFLEGEKGLDVIEANAFAGCTGLTNLILPSSVDEVAEGSFAECTNLAKVVYPASIDAERIAKAFPNAVAIDYPEGCTPYFDENGYLLASSKDGKVYLVAVPTTIEVENGKFVIPEGITDIYEGAIYGCENITSVVVPAPVNIGKGAFAGCANLKTVEIEEGVTSIGDGAFADCDGLSTIVLPSSLDLDKVGTGIFANCDSIAKVVYPGTIEERVKNAGLLEGSVAIDYDPAKMTITIDEKGYVIGVPKPDDNGDRILVAVPNEVELDENGNFVIPEGITEINGGALAGCNITSVVVPGTVKTIGEGAFEGCENLLTVAIGDGVETIGKGAFSGCTSLNTLILPNSVDNLDKQTFAGCDNITKIVIPDDLDLTGMEFPEKAQVIDYPHTATVEIDETTGVVFAKEDGKLYLVAVPEDAEFENGTYTVPDGVTNIYKGALDNCRNITTVVIPSTVTTVKESGLDQCENLTKVIYPEDLEEEMTETLAENTKVVPVTYPKGSELVIDEETGCVLAVVKDEDDNTDVILITTTPGVDLGENNTFVVPDNVTGIGKGALKDLTEVEKVVVPDNVKEIGEGAFKGLEKLTEVELGTGLTTIGGEAFTGTGITDITLPEGLTEIGEGAFKGTDLTEITLPSTVTSIGNGAFEECKDLTKVTITDTDDADSKLTSIGEGAFKGTGITDITLPDGLTEIGKGAFAGTDLTELVIPSTVSKENIGEGLVEGCDNLAKVVAPEGSEDKLGITTTPDENGKNVAVVTYPDNLDITVTENGLVIGERKELDGSTTKVLVSVTTTTDETEIKLPDDLDEIGGGAFAGCDNLTTVVIPENVKSIGKDPFEGCDNLSSVVLPSTIDKDKVDPDILTGLDNLTTVVFPDDLKDVITIPEEKKDELTVVEYEKGNTIEEEEDGTVLTENKETGEKTLTLVPTDVEEYKIPDGVTSIGGGAFTGCDKLTEIELPESLTELGESAFKGCTSLTGVKVPDGITTIGNGTFEGCENLTNVVLPDNLEGLGEGAFKGCTSLEELKVPDGVTSIGNGAFEGCEKLTNVTLPDDLDELGENAFKGCTSLESMIVPDGVTTIGKGTFEDCENLTSVVLPDNLEGLGEGAFKGCTSLTEVDLPENLKEIGAGAFKGCKELTNLILPPSVDNVGEGAFEGCEKLTKPAYPATLEKNPFESEYAVEYDPETDEITPEGWIVSKNKNTLVYAPTDLEGEYKVEGNVNQIGKNAFVGCDNLTTISIEGINSGIGSTTMTIGENAFAESGVETLNINRNWIVDGNKTPFPNLTKVNIGENVQDIPANAFNGSQLTEVDIPENVTTIGANAFNCDATEGVSIADGVYNLYIAANAFSKDANLEQVYVGRPVMGTPFAGTGVVSLAIGNHITSVVKGAYQGCAAMQSLKLGTGITEIADEAFEGCSSLEEVVIPPFTEKIGSSTFANSGVRDLLIGHSVTAIGEKAFAGANIDVLKITAVVAPKMSANTFDAASAKVYVQHPELVAHYQGVDHWKAFTNFEVLAMATNVNMTMNGGAVTTLHGPAGATFQLEASVEHEAEGEKLDHIFWFSTNPEVVTVSHDGLVTLKQALGSEGQQSPALRASRAAATQVIAHTAYAEGPLMAVDPESGQMSYIQDATSDYINGLLNGLLNVEIYNLDGVKVSSNPDELIPGIYIVRQNGEVKKITIR